MLHIPQGWREAGQQRSCRSSALFPSRQSPPGFAFPGLAGNARGWGTGKVCRAASLKEARPRVKLSQSGFVGAN